MLLFISIGFFTIAFNIYNNRISSLSESISGLETEMDALVEENETLTTKVCALIEENEILIERTESLIATNLVSEQINLDLRNRVSSLFEGFPVKYSREDLITLGERAYKTFNETITFNDIPETRESIFKSGKNLRGFDDGFKDLSESSASVFEEISYATISCVSIFFGLLVVIIVFQKYFQKPYMQKK